MLRKDVGRLLSTQLATMADLRNVDARLRSPGRNPLSRRCSLFGQRAFGILILRLRLTMLH